MSQVVHHAFLVIQIFVTACSVVAFRRGSHTAGKWRVHSVVSLDRNEE